MTRLPDVVPWLLVLDLVAAAIAMLPYRKTAAVCAEYLNSLEQSVYLRGQSCHPVKGSLSASANEQNENCCGESPDQLHEQLAGAPFAHAPKSVVAVSRDAAEDVEQPAPGGVTPASTITGKTLRHSGRASHQDMVDNTAACGCRLSPHCGPYRSVPPSGDQKECVTPDTHLTASWCTSTSLPLATRRKGVGCGP